MTTPGYSRAVASGAGNREPASIVSVDPAGRTAQAMLRSRYTVLVNTAYAIGDSIVTPAVGEQWYVERFDMDWRLAGRLPFNDDTLNIEPEPGQVSIGSASGPLELNGTEVRANGVFRIGLTYFRTNDATGKLEYSLDKESWAGVSGAGGGGGGIDSTDDLPEGSTNKYYTAARVSADAPVKTVAGKTGAVSLVKSDVGLGNVDNTSDAAKPISSATAAALLLKADLVSGIVPDSQLPEPVVREYANSSSFPAPGDPGVLYIAQDNALLYRWDGAAFTLAGGSGGGGGGISNTDALPEGVNNLYYTQTRADARANAVITSLYGTGAAKITQGNDARLSDQRTPLNNSVTTEKIVDANVTLVKLASDVQDALAASPYDLSYPQTMGVRAVGYGLNPIGVKLHRAVTFTKVTYRCQSADAGGSSTFEIRKNGATVAGTSVTLSPGAQVAGDSATGSWSFNEGDIVTVYTSAIGTTPGMGLVADLKGNA